MFRHSLIAALVLSGCSCRITSTPSKAPAAAVASESQTPYMEESKCTQLLQSTKGFNLQEYSGDAQTGEACAGYMRLLEEGKKEVRIICRKSCSEEWFLAAAKILEPEPKKFHCEGEGCL